MTDQETEAGNPAQAAEPLALLRSSDLLGLTQPKRDDLLKRLPDYQIEYPIASGLPKTAHALRPMRIDRNEDLIHYEATTFPRDPYGGCELQIRRMECFGMLTKREGSLHGSWFLDVLDEQGDILDTLEVSAKGVKYMRRTLYMKREDTALRDAFDALSAA